MVPASRKELIDTQANYRAYIHSETRTLHDNNIQSNSLCGASFDQGAPWHSY